MKTILFIEDEHSVRTVFSEVLRGEGFVVLEGADAAEAALACKDYGGPVDLLIIDAKNGVSTAKRLAALHPGLRVLLLGIAGAIPPAKRVNRRKVAWLVRPFTAETLVCAVHASLNTGPAHAHTG
jgi:DNA-binding NtrC family response regulator